MSFDWNPFRVTTIIQDLNGRWHWYCDSCGGTSDYAYGGKEEGFSLIQELWLNWRYHIEASHVLNTQDTKNWSVPLNDQRRKQDSGLAIYRQKEGKTRTIRRVRSVQMRRVSASKRGTNSLWEDYNPAP